MGLSVCLFLLVRCTGLLGMPPCLMVVVIPVSIFACQIYGTPYGMPPMPPTQMMSYNVDAPVFQPRQPQP